MRRTRPWMCLAAWMLVGCPADPAEPDAGSDAGRAAGPIVDAGGDVSSGLDGGGGDAAMAPDTREPDASTPDAPGLADAADAAPRPDAGTCRDCVPGGLFGGARSDAFVSVDIDGSGNVAVGGFASAELDDDAVSVDFGCGPLLTRSGQGNAMVAIYDASGACVRADVLGTDAERSYVQFVHFTDDGSLVVVGAAAGELDLGAGPIPAIGGQDVFVARYTPSGALTWYRRWGGAAGVSGAALDGTSIVLAGSFSGTIDFGLGPMTSGAPTSTFVVVLDQAGMPRWNRAYGAGRTGGAGVAVDGVGGLYVVGGFGGDIDFGGGALSSSGPAPDVFVAALDLATGAHRWSRIYGDADTQVATAVAAGSGGRLIVTGGLAGTVDFGGGPLTATIPNDAFVAVLAAADGAHVRSVAFHGVGNQSAPAIVPVDDGYLLGGALDAPTDFAGGTTATTSAGGFVARFDTAGVVVWSRFFGTGGMAGVSALALRGSVLAVAGDSFVPIDFGRGPVASRGVDDALLVLLAP